MENRTDCEGREKYWSELEIEEKVDRMRQEVKRFHRHLVELKSELEPLVRHRHKDGEILIPLNYQRGTIGLVRYQPIREDGDDTYF